MFKKMNFKAIVLSSVMFVLCFAVNASATPINTTATVVTSVTVAEVTPFNFGSFVPDTSIQTVTFNAGGTIGATGGIVLLGGEVGGVASTSGPSAADTVQVFVTGGLLTSGGNNMTVAGNCMGPGGALGTNDGSCTFTSAGGTENVQIGGVLTVGANQPTGVYTGTIEVTAGFF